MDLPSIISELRSKREAIDQVILSLERPDRRSTETTKALARNMTEIRGTRKPGGRLAGVCRLRLVAGQSRKGA